MVECRDVNLRWLPAGYDSMILHSSCKAVRLKGGRCCPPTRLVTAVTLPLSPPTAGGAKAVQDDVPKQKAKQEEEEVSLSESVLATLSVGWLVCKQCSRLPALHAVLIGHNHPCSPLLAHRSLPLLAPHHPSLTTQEAEETYYDAMKREMADRAAKTKAAMDALDPTTRVAMEVRLLLPLLCCGRGCLLAGQLPPSRRFCSDAQHSTGSGRLYVSVPPKEHHTSSFSPPYRATAPARTCGCTSRACPASWSPTSIHASPSWYVRREVDERLAFAMPCRVLQRIGRPLAKI